MLRIARWCLVGTAFGLGGCEDPVASAVGRAEGIISDSPTATPTIVGSLAGNGVVSLSEDGVDWVNLGSPNGVTVQLQSAAGATSAHGEQDAPLGPFSRVRLVLDGVTARIKAGSVIGAVTLAADVDLAVGGPDHRAEVVVALPPFTVPTDPGMQRTVVFELRSAQWLTASALQAGAVSDAAIQAAITASTRIDSR